MPKYAFKVTLNFIFNFAVKDATLSDIFEAKRITDRLEDQYRKKIFESQSTSIVTVTKSKKSKIFTS